MSFRKVYASTQPQQYGEINREFLAKGLIGAFVNDGRGLFNKTGLGRTVVQYQHDPKYAYGTKGKLSLTAINDRIVYTPPSTLTAATLLVMAKVTSTGNGGPWRTNGTQYDYFNYGNTLYLSTFASTRYISAHPFPTNTPYDGAVLVCTGSNTPNTHAAYINGKLIGSTNSSFVCNASIDIGCNGYTSELFAGYIYLLFDRVLSVKEIWELSSNPYQVFKPIYQPIFTPYGAYIPQIFNETLVDITMYGESILGGAPSLSATLQDSFPLQEVSLINTISSSNLTRSIAITDITQNTANFSSTKLDTNSVLEVATPSQNSSRQVVDSNNVTEASTPLAHLVAGFTDLCTSIDSTTVIANLYSSLLDSNLYSDEAIKTIIAYLTSSDSTIGADTSTLLTGQTDATLDSTTLTDIVNGLGTYILNNTNSSITSESLVAQSTVNRSTVDTPTLGDLSIPQNTLSTSVGDSQVNSDVYSNLGGSYSSITEVLTNTDSVANITSFSTSTSENLNIIEVLSSSGVYSAYSSSPLSTLDSLNVFNSVFKSLAEISNVNDLALGARISTISLLDLINSVEVFNTTWFAGISVADSLALAESCYSNLVADLSSISSIIITDDGDVLITPSVLEVDTRYIVNVRKLDLVTEVRELDDIIVDPKLKQEVKVRNLLLKIARSGKKYTIYRKGTNYVIVF